MKMRHETFGFQIIGEPTVTVGSKNKIPKSIRILWSTLLITIVNCFGVWGAIDAINSAFHMGANMKLILICTTLFVLISEVSRILRGFSYKSVRFLSILPIVFEIMICVIGFVLLKKEVINGIKTIYYIILKAYNYYYGWVFHIDPNYLSNQHNITLPFCILTGILAILLSFCVGRKNRPIIACIILLPSILISLLCGEAPGVSAIVAVACCLLCITSNMQVDHSLARKLQSSAKDQQQSKSNVFVTEELYRSIKTSVTTLVLILGMAIFFITSVKIYPGYKKEIHTYQASFSEGVFLEKLNILSGISFGVGNTGLNDGKLGSLIQVKSSGKTDLIVSFERETTDYIYLKAYTGVNYTGKQWKTEKASGYQDLLKETRKNSYYFVQPAYHLLDERVSNVPENEAEVTYVDANNKYIYMPYYSLVTKNDGKEFQDFYLFNSKKTKKSYFDFYELNGEGSVAEYVNSTQSNETWEKEYRSYVYKHYLQVPSNLKKIRKEYGDIKVSSWQEAASIIRNDLSNRAVYTLSPGSTPVWEDFVEYFLYQQKKGYCVHFASSATLMFRLMGIPARYAEGYLVKPSGSSKTVNVTDEYAHAWVEIYVDGFGWIPIEVTPGYSDGVTSIEKTIETMKQQQYNSNINNITNINKANQELHNNINNQNKDNPTKSNTNSNTTNKSNSSLSSNKNSTSKNSVKSTANSKRKNTTKAGQKKDKNLNETSLYHQLINEMSKRNVIIIIFFLLGIALVNYRYWYVKKSLRKKSYEWFHANKPTARIKSIYNEITRIAKYEGNSFDVHSSTAKIYECYPILEESDIEMMQDIMKEVLYSSHRMTEEQCRYMYQTYIKFHDSWKNKKKTKESYAKS